MVCNMLSVITAKLDAKDAEELFKSELGIQALAQALAPRIGTPTVTRERGYSWQIRGRFENEPFAIYVSESRIQVIAGYRVNVRRAEELTEEIISIAHQLALPLAQERLVQTIKAQYGARAVTSDREQGAARVTRVRIPA